MEKIFEIALAPTLIVAAIAYLAKTILSQVLLRDIEHFRLSMQVELDRSKSQFDAEIRKKSFEFEKQFSLYHERRAQIIADVYELLDETTQRSLTAMSPLQLAGEMPQAEKFKLAADSYNTLAKLYYSKKIFFDEQVATKMDSLLITLKNALFDFQFSQKEGTPPKEKLDMWRGAYKKVKEDIQPLKEVMEREFRKVLSGEYGT